MIKVYRRIKPRRLEVVKPMPYKRRKRNPNPLTTDEARTAQNIIDEGYTSCYTAVPYKGRPYRYKYPYLRIAMCDREALGPASRVFRKEIRRHRLKEVRCPPHLYPPDGKGVWFVELKAGSVQRMVDRLQPLLTKEFLRKWEETKKRCYKSD